MGLCCDQCYSRVTERITSKPWTMDAGLARGWRNMVSSKWLVQGLAQNGPGAMSSVTKESVRRQVSHPRDHGVQDHRIRTRNWLCSVVGICLPRTYGLSGKMEIQWLSLGNRTIVSPLQVQVGRSLLIHTAGSMAKDSCGV